MEQKAQLPHAQHHPAESGYRCHVKVIVSPQFPEILRQLEDVLVKTGMQDKLEVLQRTNISLINASRMDLPSPPVSSASEVRVGIRKAGQCLAQNHSFNPTFQILHKVLWKKRCIVPGSVHLLDTTFRFFIVIGKR